MHMINGKVCNVIIDSGSSENFISKIVAALNRSQGGSSPESLQDWLGEKGWWSPSKWNECTIPHSIGSGYKDQIVYDVLEMDVCHILLGRAWQYDTQTLHKGRENTYEFQWTGKKVVLLPLNKKNKWRSKYEKRMATISGKTLVKERKADFLGLVAEKSKDIREWSSFGDTKTVWWISTIKSVGSVWQT